jgi:4-hydroxy-tetrahydrodipicolinate reductase
MLRIAVLGAGRMGRELIAAAASSDDLELAGVWVRGPGRFDPKLVPATGVASGDIDEVLAAAEVAVDFSLAAATGEVLAGVVKAGLPLVCGVTGLGDRDVQQMHAAANSIPLFYDRNMSLGIAVLKELVARAAPLLQPGFVAGIHETHHVHKKDAPSGTAMSLGEALARSLGRKFEDVYRFETVGEQRRSPEDIVIRATRRGEVAGEHTVLFQSDAESLELTHTVSDRGVFAQGALQAARWLVKRGPGLYDMSALTISRL